MKRTIAYLFALFVAVLLTYAIGTSAQKGGGVTLRNAPHATYPCGSGGYVFNQVFNAPTSPARFRISADVLGMGKLRFVPTPLNQWATLEMFSPSTTRAYDFLGVVEASGNITVQIEADAESCSVYQGSFTVNNVSVSLLP